MGILLVYDVTDESSFNSISPFLFFVSHYASSLSGLYRSHGISELD